VGLFDAFRTEMAPAFNLQQALMTIIVAAVKADGIVQREEVLRIQSICALSPIFARNSSEEDLTVIRFADNITSQLGDKAVLEAAQALSPELRETAFAFATDMIAADGIVGADEEAFLTSLMHKLELPEDRGRWIVWVTMVRNRAAT